MALYVGIDVSKEKFDACGISDDGKKAFSVTCPMNRAGFEDLVLHVPKEASPLLGMESTASYHIALFSYLTAQGYRAAIINPLLIANFTKLSLRKTKTDKKAASTIAEFLLLKKDALAMETEPPRLSELKDLSRRRERLADQVTALKNDMLRILSVTFPELESIMGVFTKSALRLLTQFPSAQAIREAGYDAITSVVLNRSRGRKSAASVQALVDAAATSVGVSSPSKDLILKQEAALLLHVQEQAEEITKVMACLADEKMRRDAELLTSVKGIGDKSALSFLIELGGDIKAFENDKRLIAAAGLDPSTHESGKYKGQSSISKRGNRHLRRAIWLMASKVIISNQVFRAYYFKRRKDGLVYKMAVLATAHKLIRVLFSMLVNERQFEPERRK